LLIGEHPLEDQANRDSIKAAAGKGLVRSLIQQSAEQRKSLGGVTLPGLFLCGAPRELVNIGSFFYFLRKTSTFF